jgi:hypothetical protein
VIFLISMANNISLQNALMMYSSRIDEVGHVDEHRDMRLDVDNMTYEVSISFGHVDLCTTAFLSRCLSR